MSELQTQQSMTLPYYPFLDGLRGIAVLGVILFHFNFVYMTGGYIGVDIFFVLSGFLITGIIDTKLRQKNFSLAHFYERRCRRILPALFTVCALCIVVGLFLLMPHDFRNFAKSLKSTALFYSNMFFAHNSGYFADHIATRPLLHTWSLAVEEQFYVVYPLILMGVHKVFKHKNNVISAVIGLLLLASLVSNLIFIHINADKTFYVFPTRAWELLTGAFIFLNLRHVKINSLAAQILSVIGLLCIAYSFAFYDRNTLFPGWAAVLPCVGAGLIIWANLTQKTAIGGVLSARPLVFTGLISYGLYLYHWPVLVFTRYYLDRELNTIENVLAIIATFILSVLSYKFIEQPIRHGNFIKGRKKIFAVSLAGILILTAFAIAGAKTRGFPSRFSGPVLQYTAASIEGSGWEDRMPAFESLSPTTAIKIGDAPAPPTFILWGDSHADAIAPALEARANATGTTGLFVEYSGCLPLIGVGRLDHSPHNAPCEDVGDKVVELIKHFNITDIVLAGRWDDVNGWEKGSIELGRSEPVISFETPEGETIIHGDAFAPAFKETITQLTSLGVHIWVLEQVPPHLIDVPSGLAKSVYLKRDLKSLERSFADVEKRRKANKDVFAQYEGLPQVSFIDPADRMCADTCLIELNGRSLYRDSNHLTVYGALWVQDIFDPIFEK